MSEVMLAEVEDAGGETFLLPKLVTNCKSCGFAEYDDGIQTGCRFGMLGRFRDRGVEIETVEEEHGRGRAFFRLHDAGCTAQRPPDWVGSRGDKSDGEIWAEILDHARQSFCVTIYVAPGTGVDDVGRTVASLAGASDFVKYLSIVIPDASDEVLLNYFDYCMNDLKIDDATVPFDVISLAPDDELVDEAYDGREQLRAIDEGVHRSDAIWYAASTAGYEWPRGHFAKLNRVVVEDMDDTLCVGPERKNDGFMVVKMFHELKEVGGNMTRAVHRKARLFSEDVGEPSFYKSFKEFAAL